jgi:3-deoxy-D-manno-octulosonate 8-phosphate phosphatase (KDO 8-P phosphatase)
MNLLGQFKHISTFVFDLDGILTDGSIYVFNDGEQVRRMNIKDGYALQLAIKKGYRVVVISGADSQAVSSRLHKLGVTDVFMKVENKKRKLQEYVNKHNLQWESLLFMGDDIPDLEAMGMVGLSCAPADAAAEIKLIAKYISPYKGGKACVRDVIEKVLKLNDHWELDTSIASR